MKAAAVERFTRHVMAGLSIGAVLLSALPAAAATEPGPAWTFACAADNDLYQVVVASGVECPRYATAWEAVQAAPERSGVLILADGYPDKPTLVDTTVFDVATQKQLRLYVEFAERIPDLTVGPARQVTYERGVITADCFGPTLPRLRIVLVSSCHYLPVEVPQAQSLLVAAKVAGVDTAVFGLQDTPNAPLLLVHPRLDMLVATTKLSAFLRGRYLPAEAWRTIWQTILARLHPTGRQLPLRWTPAVRPSYGPSDPLPADYAALALRRSADWILQSRVLRHRDWPQESLDHSATYNTVRDMPPPEWPPGDGTFGVLEGFSSTIRSDGSQPMRYAVRNDCTTEVAMLLALDAAVNARRENAQRAIALLDYVFHTSGLAAGPRSNPQSPSFGLVGWALDSPNAYWGDDNARAMLAVGAVAALVRDARWNEALARCILANLRTTGVTGFREACIQDQALQERGWQSYWTGQYVQFSPHYQSWLWACNLWAYQQTRLEPLRARSEAGLRATMQAYPERWDWCLRSGTIERSRLLLPLAWLVRVDDTPEHRQWLHTIASDLTSLQDASGAIREVIGNGGAGIDSNAEYGTRETSLVQSDSDPVCDLLYSCNFALIGLHEAAAATNDPFYAQTEEKLAQFLARIQIRSDTRNELDGAWYRAFDFHRWDYWASSADWEWGPWCTETGWSQPWIAGTLALRHRHESLWDLLQQVDLKESILVLWPQMLPDGS